MSVDERRSEQDLKSELQDLKTELAVQQATQARAEATQAATQAGQAATNAAAHAGTWSTFVTGGVALSVGMFPGAGSRRRDTKVEPRKRDGLPGRSPLLPASSASARARSNELSTDSG